MDAGNVLPAGKEIEFRRGIKVDAPPEVVYDLLADVGSHLEWGGRRGKKNFRLTGLDVATTPAQPGTEWSSTGIAPDGTFEDRSIVTEATRPNVFEFRTEAHVRFKKGGQADWTVMNRYEVAPDGSGSRVRYKQRLTRATALGPMKMMLNPILGGVGRMMVAGLIKPAMQGLGSMAADRARG